MLYYFEIEYFEWAQQHDVCTTIIMDLPQGSLNDVKLNPFVIDIVNHPFMRNGIQKVPYHNPILVDNINVYPPHQIPNTAIDITCRYQEEPGLSNLRSFCYTIYALLPSGNLYFPQSQLDFTCRNYYDAYERLFKKGFLVPSPPLPNSQIGFKTGSYYINHLTASSEVIRVLRTNAQSRVEVDSVASNGCVSRITISNNYSRQIQPFLLCDWVLLNIGFIHNKGNIYGLIGVDYFAGVLSQGGQAQQQVFVKKERVGYSLIIQDATQSQQCRLTRVFYLHELQYYLHQELNVAITLSNKQLADICDYYNQVERWSKIIAQMPAEVDAFRINNPNASRQDLYNHVATHFGITFAQAQSLMVIMHL